MLFSWYVFARSGNVIISLLRVLTPVPDSSEKALLTPINKF